MTACNSSLRFWTWASEPLAGPGQLTRRLEPHRPAAAPTVTSHHVHVSATTCLDLTTRMFKLFVYRTNLNLPQCCSFIDDI